MRKRLVNHFLSDLRTKIQAEERRKLQRKKNGIDRVQKVEGPDPVEESLKKAISIGNDVLTVTGCASITYNLGQIILQPKESINRTVKEFMGEGEIVGHLRHIRSRVDWLAGSNRRMELKHGLTPAPLDDMNDSPPMTGEGKDSDLENGKNGNGNGGYGSEGDGNIVG